MEHPVLTFHWGSGSQVLYLGEVSRSQIASQSIHMAGRCLKCNCLCLYLTYSVNELLPAALPLGHFYHFTTSRCGALNKNGPSRLIRSGAVWKLRGMAMWSRCGLCGVGVAFLEWVWPSWSWCGLIGGYVTGEWALSFIKPKPGPVALCLPAAGGSRWSACILSCSPFPMRMMGENSETASQLQSIAFLCKSCHSRGICPWQ